METVYAREGNTGILELRFSDGRRERYIPTCDLEPARELLARFREVRGTDGDPFRTRYRAGAYNWYPPIVAYLYWHVFRNWVRYEPLLRRHLAGEIRLQAEREGEFGHILGLLDGKLRARWVRSRAFNTLILLNNLLVVLRRRARLGLIRTAEDDFRTARVARLLQVQGRPYTEILPGHRRALLRSLRRFGMTYFYGWSPVAAVAKQSYDLGHLDDVERRLFGMAIQASERLIASGIREYRWHRRLLRLARFEVLYGIDNTQAVYPLLYACRDCGVRTVAHQHGAVYLRSHVSYVMEGVEVGDYDWYDELIVWGRFWKERFLAINRCYGAERIKIGCDLFEFPRMEPSTGLGSAKSILVPYEFLANTAQVGQYIHKFLDLGFRVLFKPRADEDLSEQLAAYCLPADYLARLEIVDSLTPEVIRAVDAVAGTASTLLVQLRCAGRPIWYLETDFRYFEDLAEAGLFHRIRLADLDRLSDALFKAPPIDVDALSNRASLAEVVESLVLRETARQAQPADAA